MAGHRAGLQRSQYRQGTVRGLSLERAPYQDRELDSMSFISYAQNYEDVMLWRALKHIDQGFYIDVGANDPDIDSVTKAFYERGWRGINVEPAPQWFERLEKARPRDINLQLALGAEPGAITFYEIPDTGLSTAEKKFAERHEAERGYQSRELRVEKAVLQGADFGKIRPWIILVEATLPNSQEESYYDWEPLLLNAGYEYAYFDGLNRYYVSGEHENLKAAFKAPPNVFDDFVISKQIESERRAEARAEQAEERAAQVEDALRAVYRSRSWRFTWPLRWLASNVRLRREKAK